MIRLAKLEMCLAMFIAGTVFGMWRSNATTAQARLHLLHLDAWPAVLAGAEALPASVRHVVPASDVAADDVRDVPGTKGYDGLGTAGDGAERVRNLLSRLDWPAFCWAIRQVENGPAENPFCWTGVFRADLRRLEIPEAQAEEAIQAWLTHYRPGCVDVTELARVFRYGSVGARGPDVEDYGQRVQNLYELKRAAQRTEGEK